MFSKTLPVLLAMASVTLAKPVTAIPGETQEIQVALSINKESSLASITAWNKDKSATLGHSCSTTLSTGTFEATPIRFDVDATGSGSVHIGSHSYTVHSNPEFSGGITCSRMVSVAETYVACTLLVPTELKLRSLETRKLEDCFHGQGHEFEAMSAAMARNVVQPIEVLLAQNQAEIHLSANLTRRQKGGCDTTTYSTRKEGDGDPHQTNLNIQVTGRLLCPVGRGRCSKGATESSSYALQWSATSSPFGGWFSGGFSVTTTTLTGESENCPANEGEFVCVWKAQGYTTYQVRNWVQECSRIWSEGEPFLMRSPNADNKGGHQWCGYGATCDVKGASWFDLLGPPGTPEDAC